MGTQHAVSDEDEKSKTKDKYIFSKCHKSSILLVDKIVSVDFIYHKFT